jgi:hypothetical protein
LALFDERLLRIYRRIGWTPELVARSSDRAVSAGLWSVSRGSAERMRERHGILHEAMEREPFGRFNF